jgi:hypothetical protein
MGDSNMSGEAEAIAALLDQLAMMRADGIVFEPRGAAGSIARVTVAGGRCEIVCELSPMGELLSARVIEL